MKGKHPTYSTVLSLLELVLLIHSLIRRIFRGRRTHNSGLPNTAENIIFIINFFLLPWARKEV